MDKKQFIENERAHRLYANTPLLKALLIVIIPGLLMTLMTGIYIFTSQIIIVRLLPIAHGNNGQDFLLMFGHTKTEIEG
ncbi:hypothetical protein FACS1894152_4430 [Bacilli bacterium]|nr:hypothetical protein FACS1894152_4430 [Bacilli bacterium]